ncbi:MAG: twin-arginine translocase TatA/TatE family subunit [Paraglaciecola sp.]|jgi:sec-independent protein translocase protein TatA|nr:twin-arginine translocase TatA/TatE family subunit [Paraglaciecola sp.]NCT46655.1 twin-arginine translocase TatA/TatE family subunit [Paraglaciecola sp.]
MFGISVPQLLIILGIIVLLFGTKKLRSLGGDLGSAVKGFKKAISDEDKDGKDADGDADFVNKDKVEDKSAQSAAAKKSAAPEHNERR